MEKGLNQYIVDSFGLGHEDPKNYSPLVLAYIGDGIYDLVIRSIVVANGNTSANRLHQKTSKMVKAAAQSALIEAVKEELTQEETIIFKRGRNAKSSTMAKNASMSDYRRATGFEALVGFLYLNNRLDRIVQLVKIGLERTGLIPQE
ncbi:Mini-ribonuclease 3 [Anaerosacchariphilus polymeriproducens]|uniref:Mini-ribonuclease 3 n=1 Tax=Anaerosacchariphilus polymeriproducens TaxID=1812858 RepID=A0A371ASH0_9FIRM|nr:ribonuclease III domain-containing protein [Anaerosacchariphilus polymeriproducens]RDU22517.1 ribonuclease III [Anaerosacchariphilus polymeriproducens]